MGIGEWEAAHEWDGVSDSAFSEDGGSGESGVGAGSGGEGDAAEVDNYVIMHDLRWTRQGCEVRPRWKWGRRLEAAPAI